jgi:hypothetical protein
MIAPWLGAPAWLLSLVSAERVEARTSTLMYTIFGGRPRDDALRRVEAGRSARDRCTLPFPFAFRAMEDPD